jgi:hypothetical protein
MDGLAGSEEPGRALEPRPRGRHSGHSPDSRRRWNRPARPFPAGGTYAGFVFVSNVELLR